jgi:hypothetical protein
VLRLRRLGIRRLVVLFIDYRRSHVIDQASTCAPEGYLKKRQPSLIDTCSRGACNRRACRLLRGPERRQGPSGRRAQRSHSVSQEGLGKSDSRHW